MGICTFYQFREIRKLIHYAVSQTTNDKRTFKIPVLHLVPSAKESITGTPGELRPRDTVRDLTMNLKETL